MPIGNPVTLTSNVASKTISVTATASQTLFNVTGGYRINELGVFKNGLRLQDGVDYTARDGLTVTLLSAASGGDKLQFVVFDTFRVAEAIRPNVDEQTIRGNLNVVGILSASTLEGLSNFNLTSGITTFNDVRVGGALTVAGALTFEDVTNVDSIGIITARSYVSIADSIVHTGDINTAIRFPAADTFTVETGGTERLRIDSSGRLIVGVNGATSTICSAIFQGRSDGATNSALIRLAKGSSTPGTTDSLGIIQFSDNGTKHAAQIQAQRDGGTWTSGTQTPASLLFFTSPDSATGATERLRITSDGKIGINNTNPTYDVDLLKTTSGVGATMRVGSTAASGVNNASVIINNGGTGDAALDFKYESAATPRASIYVYRSDQELRFDTAGSEAARFTSTGNLKFPSGQGIDFSATANGSGTTTSELLDDYEEGTFTIGFTQTGATITANSSYDTMSYTKVGRICHIFGHIRVNTVSGSGSGNLKITGLPFSIISGVNAGRGGLHITYLDISATSTQSLKSAPFQFDEGTTNLELEVARFTSISQYGNGDELMISATYLVA